MRKLNHAHDGLGKHIQKEEIFKDRDLEKNEIKLLDSANIDGANAMRINHYIMKHKCDFSWMFQDILNLVQNEPNEDNLPSKEIVTIDVPRLNT